MNSVVLGSAPMVSSNEFVLRGKLVASHDWSMTDLRAILKEKLKFISKT